MFLRNAKNHNGTTEVLRERVVFESYRKVAEETVRYPDDREATFEVMKSRDAVFCLPFFSDGTFCLVREYHPGERQLKYGLVAGAFEHKTLEDCVRAELSEEAHLKNGNLTKLGSFAIDKYTTGYFHGFLCVDPVPDPEPAPRDHEELIDIVHGVTLTDLRGLLLEGQLNVPSTAFALLAIDKLRELDLLPDR